MSPPAEAAPVTDAGSEWRARLSLRYAPRGSRTVLAERRHVGPLTVQKPFYPEGDICHTYILHPPGGMAPGDHLAIDVAADPGAAALLTTPAAGKCYRSDGRPTSLAQRIQVADGACLEWLPQENILFEGCNVRLSTHIDLESNARFIGWEMICLGRPAAGEGFAKGSAGQSLELRRDGKPLLIERTVFEGGERLLDASWGLDGHTVLGTLIAVGITADVAERIKQQNAVTPSKLSAATLIDDVLVCRYLGSDIEDARHGFIAIWQQLRSELLNRQGDVPRIWNT